MYQQNGSRIDFYCFNEEIALKRILSYIKNNLKFFFKTLMNEIWLNIRALLLSY